MIILRSLKEKDSKRMLEWMHDKSVVEYLKEDFESKTKKDCIRFIDNSYKDKSNIHFAIVDENDIYQGTVSLKNITDISAEFAITICKDAMGKNIAINAMKEVIKRGFLDYELEYIYWYVSKQNERAVRFYDKNGYIRVDENEIDIQHEPNEYIWYKVSRVYDTKCNDKDLVYWMNKGLPYNRTQCDICVIVATYKPQIDRVIFTLESIISQVGVNLELIVSDDGSEDNLFEHIIKYLDEKKFSRYGLIYHDNNHGTVKNYLDAIAKSKSRYIKLLSPGDALLYSNTLCDWLNMLIKSEKTWSFAEAHYYRWNDFKDAELLKLPTHPQIVDCYVKNDIDRCVWNYVALDDLILGATALCERDTFYNYLSEVRERVKYAEDFVYRKMIYDGKHPMYYPQSVVFYEFGSGISTTKEKMWNNILLQDRKGVDDLILEEQNNQNELKESLNRVLKRKYMGGHILNHIIKVLEPGRIKKAIRFRVCPRISEIELDHKEVWWSRICKQ